LYFPPGREAGGSILEADTRDPRLDLVQMAGDVVASEDLAHFSDSSREQRAKA
jgi:hypothetical protein